MLRHRSFGRPRMPVSRPNILFIVVDDCGYSDLGCTGQTDYQTPALDRLAAEGVRFTQAYANSALCTNTRVALITGRYQYRLPLGLVEPLRWSDRQAPEMGIPPGFPTLPALLRNSSMICWFQSDIGLLEFAWQRHHGRYTDWGRGSQPAISTLMTKYAIISVGGKQHRVQEGERLLVDRLKTDAGETFNPRVLLVGGDGNTDLAPSITVTARVVDHVLGEKVRIGKYRQRTGYKRHTGFRASLTQIEIESIGAATKKAAAKPKAEAPRHTANRER